MTNTNRSPTSRRESTVEEIEEVIADSMTSHYSQKNLQSRILSTLFQVTILAAVVCLFVLFAQHVFPNFSETLEAWANWANDSGWYGIVCFAAFATCLILIPGLPGSLLCVTCGAVFPFWRGLFVATVGHHMGGCVSFMLARKVFKNHFTKLIQKRPSLLAFSVAAKVEQYKVTFLSRFVVMPVQLKNYGFGVLPVSFRCFFLMSFLGDIQSIIFAVYLGYLSKDLLDSSGAESVSPHMVDMDEDFEARRRIIGYVGLVVAVVMTSCASIVARKAYLDVLCDIESEGGLKNIDLGPEMSEKIRKNRKLRQSDADINNRDAFDDDARGEQVSLLIQQ